jgi:ATP-dependent Clp protease ATP-binding subunit ClpX
MSMEGVDLTFTTEALDAIAEKALQRKTGARGLRSIIENCMLEVMYDVPSNTSVKEVIITAEVVNDEQPPMRVYHKEAVAS